MHPTKSVTAKETPRTAKPRSTWARRVAQGAGVVGVIGGLGVLGAGCLSRPVTHEDPTLKTNFTATVAQQAIDKVDILFMIDNSASMGDKQNLLGQAIPTLLKRLVTPNCVDGTGASVSMNGSQARAYYAADGQTINCYYDSDTQHTSPIASTTATPEFTPVHDMHVGVVSSSLGGMGGRDQTGTPICNDNPDGSNPTNSCSSPAANLPDHNNDHGRLLNRGGTTEAAIADEGTSNYLAWFPSVQANSGKSPPANATAITDLTKLNSDFSSLISGVHEYGCGLEAQLESWYHFLVQPDPWLEVTVDSSGRAALNGLDSVVLQQRHDFLRPDSLVAVILLSDEDDSAIDPLWGGGQGWAYASTNFPGSPTGGAPRGTSACLTNPTSDACTSCGLSTTNQMDANCAKGYYTAAEDFVGERQFHMKERYGVDPQFPISRYVNGLGVDPTTKTAYGTTPMVPDRRGELHNGGNVGAYNAMNNCVNPLFATNLPDGTETNADNLCNLTPGPRRPSLVFYADIGGVPWQLLTAQGLANSGAAIDPTDATVPFKTSFAASDWQKIVGNEPENYDYSGVDPHMWQALSPNGAAEPDGTTNQPRKALPPPTASNTADPWYGREWNTNYQDQQYACTFQFVDATTGKAFAKDCTSCQYENACDCENSAAPPLCCNQSGADTTVCGSSPATTQYRGKAYPTIRELTVARDLGQQGIIASLCPRVVDTPSSPFYGYNPAVQAIADRLKNALAGACLPEALTPDCTGAVPCLILEALSTQQNCSDTPGLSDPDPKVLATFRQSQMAAQGALGDPTLPVCELHEDTATSGAGGTSELDSNGSCIGSSAAGWCYVTGKNAGQTCGQAIKFSGTGNPQVGAIVSLQCIEGSTGGDGGSSSAACDAGM